MLDLLRQTVDRAAGHCAYAEARHVHHRSEALEVHDELVDGVDAEESEGLGIRVLVGGAWGFAATRDVSPAGAEAALRRALAVAAAQPAAGDRPLAPVTPVTGHWDGPCAIDPFAVSLEERLAHLFAAVAAMRGGDPRIVRAQATCAMGRTTKALATSDGTAVTQAQTTCGAGIEATAVGNGELQTRTYPTSHGGNVASAGWEQVLALDLAGHAPRVAAEALELLTARECPEGRRTLVLHGEQLALQLHESIGHALELDRMLLSEASYAGTSWVTVDDLVGGALRYGSDRLNVSADATLAGGLGSFGWDDEGVPAARTMLVERGTLRAALSDRQSAAAAGLDRSGGCARAEGFARQPMVRMTNVSVEPGDAGTLGDLIADTDDGLYLESNRSWSIDDRRWQFQFATEVAREIRGGELGRLYRNPSYAGITPQFWGSLDAVCGRADWRLWGLTNCGKGEPGQVMAVSHGTAPARFRDIQVGVA